MTANLTPEQEAKLLADYHTRKAQLLSNNAEADRALQNFRAIMSRNQPRVVTTQKKHICSRCTATIQKGTRAWYIPGCIAARSSRCTDPTFTKARYTCLSCAPEVKQP